MTEDVLVSVICFTYNQEPYIEAALQGIVSQQTDFKYEVIVHDDASTDGTTDIVNRYAELYPDIIIPIIQTVNQYSRKIDCTEKYVLPAAKGKYIAFCEGDDYWCDNMKLQKQVTFLEQHSEYSSCCSNSYIIDCRNGEKRTISSRKEECDLALEDVVLHLGNGSYQTASLVYKKELAQRWREEKVPIFRMIKGVGDYPLRIYLLMNGKTRYFSDCMTVYRSFVPGSWSERNAKGSIHDKEEYISSIIKCLRVVDDYTEYKCHDGIETDILEYERQLADLTGNYELYKKTLSSPYNSERNTLKNRIKRLLGDLYGIHWKKEYKKRARLYN